MMSFVLCSKIKIYQSSACLPVPSMFAISRAFPLALSNLLPSVTLLWLHNCFKDLAKAESNVFYLVYASPKFTAQKKGIRKTPSVLGELAGESFK